MGFRPHFLFLWYRICSLESIMANTILLPQTVNAAHTVVTITDNTTYTDPSRALSGIYLSVSKVDFRGSEVVQTLTPNSADPGVVSSWTLAYSLDGHYRIRYIAVPDYNAGTTYAKYEVAFDNSNLLAYVSAVDSNTGQSLLDTDYWTPVLDPTILVDYVGASNEPVNADAYVTNLILSELTADYRDSAALSAALELCTDCNRYKDVSKFTLLSTFYKGMVVANSNSEFSKGEKIARRAQAVAT